MLPASFLAPPGSATQLQGPAVVAPDSPTLQGSSPAILSSDAVALQAASSQYSRTAALVAAGTLSSLALTLGAAARRRRATRRQRLDNTNTVVCAASASSSAAPVVLEVKDVVAESTDDDHLTILKGLNLSVREGEVHAVMGLNGSGKSTLSKVLVGDSAYEVTGGEAQLGGKDLFAMESHERSLEGLFLAFQSPPAVNGVSNLDFLRAVYNAQRRHKEEPELDVIEFYGYVTEKLTELKVNPDFLNRNVNEGFSGGERKRNEMLQMSVLQPRLAILDEIDSGLDVDALRDVSSAISVLRKLDEKRSFLVVTHFQRFLDYLKPDFVHVMHQGRIIKSGGPELADKLDKDGYEWVINEQDTSSTA